MPEVIKVYITSDGRYVPPEGRFHYNHAKAIDTTYVIRAPYKHQKNYFSNKQRDFVKSQAYASFRQFVPIVPPSKPGIYKPIVTPLVLPGNTDLLEETYVPTWNIHYDWDSVYQPFDDYIVDNIAFFNSHEIITDYQGFLNKFQERSSRHIESHSTDKNQNLYPRIQRPALKDIGIKSRMASYQNVKSNTDNTIFGYPNLTRIPETGFTCNGRRGMFADVKTKCQYSCLENCFRKIALKENSRNSHKTVKIKRKNIIIIAIRVLLMANLKQYYYYKEQNYYIINVVKKCNLCENLIEELQSKTNIINGNCEKSYKESDISFNYDDINSNVQLNDINSNVQLQKIILYFISPTKTWRRP
ncbi:hypothetical protein WH47_01206 [Habropoda laboriosa]|uniref:Uncharacterized protein n=1 Tax=Habropoda laboriosa TaxID=597456 RepID=A0A0L7QK39_9HYME|nr:hypothetical protein WH47_01206 [Habropoda laboriosa]